MVHDNLLTLPTSSGSIFFLTHGGKGGDDVEANVADNDRPGASPARDAGRWRIAQASKEGAEWVPMAGAERLGLEGTEHLGPARRGGPVGGRPAEDQRLSSVPLAGGNTSRRCGSCQSWRAR